MGPCYSIGHKVGRPNIQKLVGANNVVLADKMIFITTSDFSGVAISYAEEVEVKLINGNKLMELLHKQGFY
ncbi:restriction endonuclease [Blautia massiliensis (ex Durand et al. 2017)]|uniref:restriction endonuclease n=1 Tax=Blautia massiliensis (ex Durand et al. 2017) TaxID=1737424 RepID=UPI00189FE355